MWTFLDSGKKSALENMALDGKLLDELSSEGAALLHFYDWEGLSATYGYFTKVEELLDKEAVEDLGLRLARRPTGGGVIFHVTDLAFSVLVPACHEGFSDNTLDNYNYVNRKVLLAVKGVLKETGLELLAQDPVAKEAKAAKFCMAMPTIYDVMLGDRKVAGAAQRKRKQGFLHQGSIALALPGRNFLEKLLPPEVVEAMHLYTYPLLQQGSSQEAIQEMRLVMRKHLQQIFLEG
ncbi:MAG: lipoate--protein ligase family protein [Chlamydiae bacterium]|nr:lipoate--protein ligase family protein [Chlamydiota bacterium]